MINNMVLSREIEWIGYEHKRNMLQVEFIVGAIYQYENVPETVYQEFLTAPSHGRFFESNIKNKYQVRKIRLALRGGDVNIPVIFSPLISLQFQWSP